MKSIFTRRLLPACGLLLMVGCVAPAPEDETTSETYTNDTYGYSFSYPAAEDFIAYSDLAQAIGTQDGEMFEADVEITVHESDSSIDILFEDFINRTLLNSCAADGPTGSIECTDIESENTFTTQNGLEGKAYYLTWREENFETQEVITERKGPFIVFALLPERSSRFTALIIRPGFNVDAEDVDTDLIEDIANSLTISAVLPQTGTGDLAGEGEFCGGIAAFRCGEGLTCVLDGDFPDAGGTCVRSGTGAGVSSEALTSDQQSADSYIRANIGDLSPEPAVLGGTFYVTDIAWTGDNEALVSYEDGHIALRARATYAVSGSTVTVDSFDIVER